MARRVSPRESAAARLGVGLLQFFDLNRRRHLGPRNSGHGFGVAQLLNGAEGRRSDPLGAESPLFLLPEADGQESPRVTAPGPG